MIVFMCIVGMARVVLIVPVINEDWFDNVTKYFPGAVNQCWILCIITLFELIPFHNKSAENSIVLLSVFIWWGFFFLNFWVCGILLQSISDIPYFWIYVKFCNIPLLCFKGARHSVLNCSSRIFAMFVLDSRYYVHKDYYVYKL